MSFIYTLYQHTVWFAVVLVALALWELVWKGFALWHSARGKQTAWFVVILLVNTLGILPIIYLLFFKPKLVKEEKA